VRYSYRKILTQILVQLNPQSVSRVKALFGWIAFAKRPLKRLELLSAITFSLGNPSVSHLVPDFILTVCGTLIEERPDATLAFIHITLKEYVSRMTDNLALLTGPIDSFNRHPAIFCWMKRCP
jgi:hypothetical protein